jgi:hypothetical protein
MNLFKKQGIEMIFESNLRLFVWYFEGKKHTLRLQ